VRIRVNGEPRDVSAATIADLLAHLDIDARRVAVEHNLIIVKRDQYAEARLADGDEIEIVNFVGGGGLKLETAQLVNRSTVQLFSLRTVALESVPSGRLSRLKAHVPRPL
jgi:sulfur carrier protein